MLFGNNLYNLKPVAVAEWRARLLTVLEVSRSNPDNLPLLQMWHVGNMTGHHAVYMLIQCTPLLAKKVGVAPDVTFQDHSMQVRKSAGKISTLDLKPMRKDTQSPKQEQSVAPQNGPWSRQKKFKKKKIK